MKAKPCAKLTSARVLGDEHPIACRTADLSDLLTASGRDVIKTIISTTSLVSTAGGEILDDSGAGGLGRNLNQHSN